MVSVKEAGQMAGPPQVDLDQKRRASAAPTSWRQW